MLQFRVFDQGAKPPPQGVNQVYLVYDRWNDFSFVTMFYVYAHDEHGNFLELGNVKIGFQGQTKAVSTYSTLPAEFQSLPGNYFSLSSELNYYKILGQDVSQNFRDNFTSGLRDLVANLDAANVAAGEDVFRTSLLRDVSVSTIDGQFRRVLHGGVPLTEFKFRFDRPGTDAMAGISLTFEVTPHSAPGTNIHAIIGRNGIGKTTLLNGMISAITEKAQSVAKFSVDGLFGSAAIDDRYFSSLVSVAFSAFDPFKPPAEQPDPEKGTCYYYIGLKDLEDDTGTLLKPLSDLHEEFVASLMDCMRVSGKRDRWLSAIRTLESDENFAEMGLGRLLDVAPADFKAIALHLVKRMSSGHAIVLLTITRLVARVEEKTLVLLDEPESHLHPPLLSAFTRALSELLISRNGVAIIATHSPVVLQEVPKSCVWFLTRSGLAMRAERPQLETFGENVGVLTREVFRLEVVKSGFHGLLNDAVFRDRKSYDDVLIEYKGQLGFEARSILKAMVIERDRGLSRP